VHVDCENPQRLGVQAALSAHFAVSVSREFVRALQPLTAGAAAIERYDTIKLEKL